jgi:hypothetical protein
MYYKNNSRIQLYKEPFDWLNNGDRQVPVWNGQGIRNDWLRTQCHHFCRECERRKVHLEEGAYIIGTPNPNLSHPINNQLLLSALEAKD